MATSSWRHSLVSITHRATEDALFLQHINSRIPTIPGAAQHAPLLFPIQVVEYS
jgi:hypothetical protein